MTKELHDKAVAASRKVGEAYRNGPAPLSPAALAARLQARQGAMIDDLKRADGTREITANELAAILAAKGRVDPEDLTNATGIMPEGLTIAMVERFIAEPNETKLTQAQFQFLEDWLAGCYGISQSTGQLVRIVTPNAGTPRLLGVKAPGLSQEELDRISKTFTPFGPAGAVTITFPDGSMVGSEERIAAHRAKMAELEAAAKAAAEAAKPKSVVHKLMTFGRG